MSPPPLSSGTDCGKPIAEGVADRGRGFDRGQFLDSTALGVLIEAKKLCDDEGGTMRIAVSEPRILKIFEITGLTELFDIRSIPRPGDRWDESRHRADSERGA